MEQREGRVTMHDGGELTPRASGRLCSRDAAGGWSPVHWAAKGLRLGHR